MFSTSYVTISVSMAESGSLLCQQLVYSLIAASFSTSPVQASVAELLDCYVSGNRKLVSIFDVWLRVI